MEVLLKKIKALLPRRAFIFLQPPYHFFLAYAAAFVFGFPSRRIIVIGVTGTKGKTTTVRLIHEILAASGAPTTSVSSLEFRVGERVEANTLKMTMPGRFFLQRFLRRAVREGCRYAVIEVTSQGITQYRHRGIRFSGAVMTNVTPEHLEAHGGFEEYLRAKLDIFWRLPRESIAVINRDDDQARRFGAATAAHTALYNKEGIVIGAKQWRVADIVIGRDNISFSIAGQAVRSPLLGEFNFYNILAAITVGLSQGIALDRIAAAIGRVSGIPGRMEFVARDPFSVVVDYAHTPDSLKNVYAFLRENSNLQVQSPKLICILGAAGGGRDQWKRPEMGKVAAEYCDEIILTNEDPYDENPEAILDEISFGFSQVPVSNFQVPSSRKILDRRDAIGEALRRAAPGDTVVITGKGAEPWMMLEGGKKIPWDDRAIVRDILKKI